MPKLDSEAHHRGSVSSALEASWAPPEKAARQVQFQEPEVAAHPLPATSRTVVAAAVAAVSDVAEATILASHLRMLDWVAEETR